MRIVDDYLRIKLNDADIEYVYRVQELRYLAEDAKNHVAEMIENESIFCSIIDFYDSDYNNLAILFRDNHDCNITDNDQWETIIKNYVKEHEMEELPF